MAPVVLFDVTNEQVGGGCFVRAQLLTMLLAAAAGCFPLDSQQ